MRARSPGRGIGVGGFVPLSTTDYPERLSAVVFCQGCPWRCAYCHNPHLQPPRSGQMRDWSEIRNWLMRRRGLLDAVVFSGGEPTAQPGLRSSIEDVRAMGFRAGLHTAGAYPSRLKQVLPLLDWVGFDVKTVFGDYESITGAPRSNDRALKSLTTVLESGVECEVRTTVHPDLIEPDALLELARLLSQMGVRRYVFQEFRGQGCRDPRLCMPRSRWSLTDDLRRELAMLFGSFEFRPGDDFGSSIADVSVRDACAL